MKNVLSLAINQEIIKDNAKRQCDDLKRSFLHFF